MHYCVLHVLFAVFFMQTLRYTQRRGVEIPAALAINYVVAACAAAVWLAVTWDQPALAGRWWAPRLLGGVNGLLYFLSLVLVLAGYRVAGVGVTWAFMSVASVVPVLVSRFAWAEPMSALQWAAVALMPGAVLLMRPLGKHKRLTLISDLVLLSGFVVAATVQTIHKSFSFYGDESQRPLYTCILFSAAAVSSMSWVLARKMRCDLGGAALGAVMGTANFTATFFILLGIAALGAVVFYPIASSLLISASAIVARILWKERLTRRQIAGIAVAVAIVVLANLGAGKGPPAPAGTGAPAVAGSADAGAISAAAKRPPSPAESARRS